VRFGLVGENGEERVLVAAMDETAREKRQTAGSTKETAGWKRVASQSRKIVRMKSTHLIERRLIFIFPNPSPEIGF
jgi:bifunctional ADP-heptose synthase (sugar kinase/adenylyltransferase)